MPRHMSAVKEPCTPKHGTKRYLAPEILNGTHPTAGIGYFDAGIFRSVRTGRGRLYAGGTLNILQSILDEIERDGLTIVEIVIEYRRTGVKVTYRTTTSTIRQHAQIEFLNGTWQYSLPLEYWSVDGAEPAVTLPATEQQLSLF